MKALARNLGSQSRTPFVLLALVLGAQWLAGRPTAAGAPALLLAAAPAVLLVMAGCGALYAIRPQRAGLSPPHVMLSLGFAGMVAGLGWDVAHAGPAALADLCAGSRGLPFASALAAHLAFLPGMHAGMLAGGMLAIPALRLLRPGCGRYLCAVFAQNLLCSGWMLLGMTAGALWLARWAALAAPGGDSLAAMLGGMFAGMTWGMVISVGLYRSYFHLRGPRGLPPS